jgi:hypothetical protein
MNRQAAVRPLTVVGRHESNGTSATSTDPSDAIVAELNREYAVVLMSDRPVILKEETEPDGPPIRLLTVAGFREWLQPQTCIIAGRTVPVADVWRRSPQRRQYSSLTFAPGTETQDSYNLWRGWGVERRPIGSQHLLFLDHILQNVCSGSEEWFAWVMGWFAAIFQRPLEKVGTSLAVRGKQGVGKTIVGETIGHLLGRHYRQVADSRFVTGRFNAHLADALLLHADEAFWAGDHAAAGKLKDLITGDRLPIEFKGKEPVWVRNLIRLFITSNHDWVVPAGMGERRFTVLDVADHRAKDHSYFGNLQAELDNGGYEQLLDYLLTYDITSVPLRHVLNTEALFEQKVASLNSEQQWWLDVLQRGRLPQQGLYAAYVEHAKNVGTSRRSIETQLGLTLRRFVPGLQKVRRQDDHQQREYRYVLPPLDECRTQFELETGARIHWPSVKGEAPPKHWEGGDECPT